MSLPRRLGTLAYLASLTAILASCENTPTSNAPAADTSKPSEKAGPSISLSVVPASGSATSYSLKGSVGKSGTVSVWTTVTLNGIDRSEDFKLPASQIVTTPFDLGAITLAAKTTAQIGEYVVTVTAIDSLGNTSRATGSFSLRSKPVALPPGIRGFGVDNASPEPGFSFNTRGTVEFETGKATVSYSVSPSAGITLPASFTVLSGSSIGRQIALSYAAPAGTYTLTVTVTDENGLVTRDSATFNLPSKSIAFDMLEPDLSVGAQNAMSGSYIDVDYGVVYTGGTKDITTIDAIFFADATGQISLMSPAYAGSNELGGVGAWSMRLSTIIVDAGTSPIRDVDAAKAAIGTSSSQAAAAAAGHYYAMKLANGQYAAVRITSLSGSGKSATGTITLFVEW